MAIFRSDQTFPKRHHKAQQANYCNYQLVLADGQLNIVPEYSVTGHSGIGWKTIVSNKSGLLMKLEPVLTALPMASLINRPWFLQTGASEGEGINGHKCVCRCLQQYKIGQRLWSCRPNKKPTELALPNTP